MHVYTLVLYKKTEQSASDCLIEQFYGISSTRRGRPSNILAPRRPSRRHVVYFIPVIAKQKSNKILHDNIQSAQTKKV